MANYHPILMKFDTQTVTKAEMIDRFQDGRHRHVGNSSACYKLGNYHPIFMQIGMQTKKNMLTLKVTIPEV
jgi:hypothetical protein